MLRSRPLLVRFVGFVLLPCAAAGLYTWHNLHGSLPAESGTVAVDGLKAPVQIRRDGHGVPTIVARNDNDAFFAAGYVHAQDRLWQLELQRRIVAGRLSEVFGKASVKQDIWLRTLGLRESAKTSWEALSPDAKASLTAYAAGINAFISEHHPLPPEFVILGIQPEPWSVYDSLGWNNMFALTLGGNFREEITRYVAGQYLRSDQLAALFEGYPAAAPVTVASAEQQQATRALMAVGDLQRQLESDLKLGGKYVGSNAWVVSGKLTADGQPILANDPHLPLQMPSLWYAMRLKGDRLDVAGMSLVGLPVVIFGRNQQIAWGGTNMMADQQDLYFERVNPANAAQYEVDGHWEPFATRTETIEVQNDFPAVLRGPLRPVTIEVRATRHGPVISDQFNLFEQPVALRWNVLEQKGAGYESFLRADYARDWASFNEAFRGYVAPALNLLYIDRQGNIGYAGVGSIPIRRNGEGTVPVPGWNDDYDWTGTIPFDGMPRSFNPPKGYIVNANNRVTWPGYPYFISHDWAPPARAARIEQLLKQKLASHKLTVADIAAMQGDTANLPSAALAKVLAGVIPQDDRQREALGYLSRWDGNMRRDSVAATIFVAWSERLRHRIFADELDGAWNRREKTRQIDTLGERMPDDELAAVLANDRLQWCDDKSTTAVETCQQAMTWSLRRTIKDLTRLHGSAMSGWAWGDVHTTRYEHTPFSQASLLRRLFERQIANGGSPNSINVASATPRGSEGYVQTFGAGFRQIITLGARSGRHLYMNSTGQSGNAASKHYDDMIAPFRDVTYYSFEESAAPAKAALTLKPR